MASDRARTPQPIIREGAVPRTRIQPEEGGGRHQPGMAGPIAKPKVCVWYWGRRGGGVRLTRELIEALAEAGCTVSVSLSMACRDHLHLDDWQQNAQIVTTYDSAGAFLRSVPRLAKATRDLLRLFRRARPDVILIPMLTPWQLLALPGLRAWQSRMVIILHDPNPHPGSQTAFFDWLVPRMALRTSSRPVALTQFVADELALIAMGHRSIEVVPHGIPSKQAEAVRPRAFPRAGTFRFLSIGRLEAYKGWETLRRAIDLLDADGWELVISGDGPCSARVSELFGALPNVTLVLGWIPESNTFDAIAAADCIVCPYDEASQSGVIVEAIAAAVPVIATSVGGLPEQMDFGRFGLVVPPGDAEALVAALIRMREDTSAYEAFSRAEADAARNRYAWPKLLPSLLKTKS